MPPWTRLLLEPAFYNTPFKQGILSDRSDLRRFKGRPIWDGGVSCRLYATCHSSCPLCSPPSIKGLVILLPTTTSYSSLSSKAHTMPQVRRNTVAPLSILDVCGSQIELEVCWSSIGASKGYVPLTIVPSGLVLEPKRPKPRTVA